MGSWTELTPTQPLGRCQAFRSHRIPLLGWEWAAQGSLGNWQGQVCRSFFFTEAENDRFSVMDTADAVGYLRKAENSVGAHRTMSSPGQREKRERRSSGWFPQE